MQRNWKTTAGGVAALGAALLMVAHALLGGKDVDWLTVGALISSGMVGLFAQDAGPR